MSAEPKPGRCGAKLRNKSEYCDRYPMIGKTRCKQHGGATPVRIIHGRYSRIAPARWLPTLEKALDNANLTSMNEEIAMVEAMITEKMEALSNEEAPPILWELAREAFAKVKEAIAKGDAAQLREALDRLGDVIHDANGSAVAKCEIALLDLAERLRRLKESEAKRIVSAFDSMTRAEVLLSAQMTRDLIIEIVPKIRNARSENDARLLVADEFARRILPRNNIGIATG